MPTLQKRSLVYPFEHPSFYSNTNKLTEVLNLFPREKWVEVAEFLDEYDVIRGGNKVVLQALELVYDELGI